MEPPPNISPESFSKTRRATGESTESVLLFSVIDPPGGGALRLLGGCAF
jgi:hypothetical protein